MEIDLIVKKTSRSFDHFLRKVHFELNDMPEFF